MIDEKALRREGFTEGVAIVLSDGQEWTFPVPAISAFYPRRNGDGKFALVEGYDFGPEYDRLTDRMVETEGEESSVVEHMSVLAEVAFFLLSRNYHVDPSGLASILRFETGERREKSLEMWQAIKGVALGNTPKGVTPAGAGQA